MTAPQLALTPHPATVHRGFARLAAPALAVLVVVVLALGWLEWLRLVHVALTPPHVG